MLLEPKEEDFLRAQALLKSGSYGDARSFAGADEQLMSEVFRGRWLRGEVVDFEPQGAKSWPLVRVEGETEARAYFFMDTAIAPGFTFVDLLASPKTSTWAYAAERNGLSPAAALGKGLGRLIFWHLIQPPLYVLVLVACADLIDPLQLGLGIAVGLCCGARRWPAPGRRP